MPEKILNPVDLFPVYNKWLTFLQQQDPEQVSMPPQIDIFTHHAETSYRALNGVVSSLEFWNKEPGESLVLERWRLSQKYTDPQLRFKIENHINNQILSSVLDIPQPTTHLARIVISSKSSRASNFTGEWADTQQVFMALSDDYLHKLQAEGLIPDDARSRVWIRRQQDTVVTTVEAPIDQHEFPLDDDTLRRICDGAGFAFEFDAQAAETRGAIGTVVFNLHHARATSLNQDNIWRALTGANPKNSFIFPVQVIRQR